MVNVTNQHSDSIVAAPCRIVIAGGGLAGIAVAIALGGIGHDVTVLERMSVVSEIGAGIQIPPNASKVLSDLGVLDAVEALSFKPHAAKMRSYQNGDVLSSTTLFDPELTASVMPYLVIHRADLHRVLWEKAKSLGVTLRLSCDISNIDFALPSVELTTGEVILADVIFGADGERSVSQRLLRGFDDPPKDSGDEVIRFTVPCAEVLKQGDLADLVYPPNINFWIGPEAHAITYSLKKDGLLNVVLTRSHAIDNKVKYGPQPTDIEEVRKAFRGWDPRFERLLDIAQHCAKWTLLISGEVQTWTSKEGTFCLVGDAAHAMLPFLGQGAAQAFEDAAVLRLLFQNLNNKSDIPKTLSTFEKVRKPRTKYLCGRSLSMKEVFALKDGDEQRTRDHQLLYEEPFEGFPNIFSDPVFSRVMWNYDAAKAIESVQI